MFLVRSIQSTLTVGRGNLYFSTAGLLLEASFEDLLTNGGPRLPFLFTSHSYRHLEGYFLAEMAEQQIGKNGRETKLA